MMIPASARVQIPKEDGDVIDLLQDPGLFFRKKECMVGAAGTVEDDQAQTVDAGTGHGHQIIMEDTGFRQKDRCQKDEEKKTDKMAQSTQKDLIDHPVKKQYGRDQIAHLLFIAMTKSALSLDDVASLFRMQKDIYSCEEAYGCFRDFFEKLYYGEQIDLRKEVKIEKILLRDIVSLIVQNEALHRRLKEVTVIK